MKNKEVFNVSIPLLHDATQSSFYDEKNEHGDIDVERKYLRGEMYFDSELTLNEKKNKGYRDGLVVGNVEFFLGNENEFCESIIYVRKVHLIHELATQNIEMRIACGSKLFGALVNASLNECEVQFEFKAKEWILDDGDYKSRCDIESVKISQLKKDKEYFYEKRVRHVENFLLTNLCGGSTEGQIPNICKEFSESFVQDHIFRNRNDLLEKIVDLVRSIKWTLELEKSKQRIDIENGKDKDLAKIFSLTGSKFDVQFEKIFDPKSRNQLLAEYNSIWKRFDAVKMFKDGYAWSGEVFPTLADEYLAVHGINSVTFNKILMDGLICKDIADAANRFQFTEQMSSGAILSVVNGVYTKADVDVKNKKFKEVLLLSLFKFIGWSLGMLIGGFFTWWLTSLLAGDSEMAHYVLFSGIFSASMIVTALNQSRTVEAIKESREEFNFYTLRDMCALHKQGEFMDGSLLRNLAYKIEERGIQLNNYFYSILARCN